jgi:excisionase family DNA binding protein
VIHEKTNEEQQAGALKMKRLMAPAKPASAPATEIMTVASLALYLRCSPASIYRLLKEKQIPAFKLGSDWRFSRSAIDEWIAGQYDTKPPITRVRKSKLS